jgi:hypothetical protein
MEEHPATRQISFTVDRIPPDDWVAKSLARDPGPLPLFMHNQRASSARSAIPV